MSHFSDQEDGLPEVEVNSLPSDDQALPRFKLKADHLTEVGGGCVQDFIQTPVLDPIQGREVIEGLTSEQAEATLAYFLSCGDRLSQMTKTYHDVEAVTRLLQEKENDLELAAKIGQELLERNRRLEERVLGLEVGKKRLDSFQDVYAFSLNEFCCKI